MKKIVIVILACAAQLHASTPAPYSKEWIYQEYLKFLRKPGSPNPYADYYAAHPDGLQKLKDQLVQLEAAAPQDKKAIQRLEDTIFVAQRAPGPVPAQPQTYRQWLETMVRR